MKQRAGACPVLAPDVRRQKHKRKWRGSQLKRSRGGKRQRQSTASGRAVIVWARSVKESHAGSRKGIRRPPAQEKGSCNTARTAGPGACSDEMRHGKECKERCYGELGGVRNGRRRKPGKYEPRQQCRKTGSGSQRTREAPQWPDQGRVPTRCTQGQAQRGRSKE